MKCANFRFLLRSLKNDSCVGLTAEAECGKHRG